MRTFLCFLLLIVFTTLFAESFTQDGMNLSTTIKLLGALGPKECLKEVENATSDRFTSLPTKRQEIPQALKISYNSIFELLKKKITNGHWENAAFQNLMEHLDRQAKSNVPVTSSELETLVKNFKLLGNFLTQQNFSRCAWEIARNEILVVMNHFRRMTHKRRHNFPNIG